MVGSRVWGMYDSDSSPPRGRRAHYMVTLTAKPGSWGIQNLYLNGGLLLVVYGGGDCDTIHWPFGASKLEAYDEAKDRSNLASALYDEFEMGNLNERTVLLPDGTEFNIDSNLGDKS